MGHISKERYDQKKVDRLAEHLRVYNEKGYPIDFEIIVDSFKVVRRTNDPAMFSMYEGFVDADTKSVEFLFYTGSSNNNNKHIFYFGEMPPPQQQNLSGVDIDERIEEGVQRKLDKIEFEELKKENAEMEAEIKELETQIEKLEKEKAEFQANQSPLRGFLGDVGSSVVESFFRKNPKLLSAIPGGDSLAGLFENGSNQKADEGQSQETEVSFKAKTSSTVNGQDLSEEDQAAIAFVNQLKAQFTKDEFDKVLLILQTLANDKSKIELIINHVNLKKQ